MIPATLIKTQGDQELTMSTPPLTQPMPIDNTQNEPHIWTVSDINQMTRVILEKHFSLIRITGEISNLSCPRSGHIYFSLKDAHAQIRCALFRPQQQRTHSLLENGLQVIAAGHISLYTARGDYQLIVKDVHEAGHGSLQLAYERLKKKLYADGLFDVAHKKPIPERPHHIGLITSATGAALQDIKTVLARRCPLVPVTLYPSMVQGPDAVPDLLCALDKALLADPPCDVLIIARGGGSIEDLWAFNDEQLARALFACHIPIITGIGHEIDTTIADYIADLRAPTPSAAAECASVDHASLYDLCKQHQHQLNLLIHQALAQATQQITTLSHRLTHPEHLINQQRYKVTQYQARLHRAAQQHIQWQKQRVLYIQQQMTQQHPAEHMTQLNEQLLNMKSRLSHSLHHRLSLLKERLLRQQKTLGALNPDAILVRGYSIIRKTDQTIVSHINQVKASDTLTAQVSDGTITVVVENTDQ